MVKKPLFILILAMAVALGPAATSRGAPAASVLVNISLDTNDGDTSSIASLIAFPGARGEISLREAIIAANNTPGADTIGFNLSITDPHYTASSGYWTIPVASALPPLSGGDTTIDGYSQAGASPASASSPATIVIEIDGSAVAANNGFNLTSSGNTIRGLAIHSFPVSGILIGVNPADPKSVENNLVEGCYIGLDFSGSVAIGNGANGVYIGLGAQNNTIGGSAPANRNVISGNGWNDALGSYWEGIGIHSVNTQGNQVVGNYIGTNAAGDSALDNLLDGVRVYGGAHENTVGPGNLISGNARSGVRIVGAGTDHNLVIGNVIGADALGTTAIPNDSSGVVVTSGAQNNTIGGADPASSNLISGNHFYGIFLSGTDTTGNTISGNRIGVNLDGSAGLGNTSSGVAIVNGAWGNTVGGATTDYRNLISGNGLEGVIIGTLDTRENTVSNNHIGLDADGTAAIPNHRTGISIVDGGTANTIGPGNVISGNVEQGVLIQGSGSDDNRVMGNYIGLAGDGESDMGNTLEGVRISQAANGNIIGGDAPEDTNRIGYNGGGGVHLTGAGTSENVLSYNGIAYQDSGVILSGGASLNQIGPMNGIAINDIGVHVYDAETLGNDITQNLFFKNITPITIQDGAHGGILPPTISSTGLGLDPGAVLVEGTACAGCRVEIHASGVPEEGGFYIEATTADSGGEFSLTIPDPPYRYLSGTATDPVSGTSEFSDFFTAYYEAYLPLTMR